MFKIDNLEWFTCTQLMFPYGQTLIHFATMTQSNSKLTFSFIFKNASTSLVTFDAVTIPYSTTPVFVNTISSQNGAITIADESGNNFGK